MVFSCGFNHGLNQWLKPIGSNPAHPDHVESKLNNYIPIFYKKKTLILSCKLQLPNHIVM